MSTKSRKVFSAVVQRLHCFCAQVVLEEWPHGWGGMCIGCVVEIPKWTGSDYQILGCRVYNVRGNGVVARGSRGTIADSTFTHLKGATSPSPLIPQPLSAMYDDRQEFAIAMLQASCRFAK